MPVCSLTHSEIIHPWSHASLGEMTHVFPSKDTPLQRSFPGQRPNTALNRATGTARNGAKPPVEGQGGRTAQEGSPGWRAAASRPQHASWAGTRGHHLSRAYRTHRAANPPRNRNQGFLETRANTAQPPPAHSLLLTPLPSGDMLHRQVHAPNGSDFSVEHSAHCQGTSASGMYQQACLWFAFCSPELPREVANWLLAVGGGCSEAFGCL